MQYPEISVVVPCYKEAPVNWEKCIAIYEYLKQSFERFEIILVTDGSPDQTRENIIRLGNARPEIPLILIPFREKSRQRRGCQSRCSCLQIIVLFFIDADLTISITELKKFIPALDSADIVIASRLV